MLIAIALTLLNAPKTRSAPVPQATAQQAAGTKAVGTITAIAGNTITLKTDAAASVTFQVDDTTRMARVAPGQTDLKNATVIHLTDLQVGDRVLVRATPSADGKALTASAVIAMKHSDVEARQEQERQDWQKRGIGGLVSAVDPASGTITITAGAGPTKRTISVHTTSSTIFRRYAPDSVKFDEAKPSSLDQIKPGDQLRARGNRNPDDIEFAAEEVVSGSFRNIAGTIESIDAAAGTITVKDLLTKKSVVVKISADSQVRKLPQQMAQFMAMRLKGGTGGGGDLQQILSRMPPASISDLQKGDAVMIVSTEGTDSGTVTAITLVSGVETLLQASPAGAQAMMLTPWSLGGGGAGDDTGGGAPQ